MNLWNLILRSVASKRNGTVKEKHRKISIISPGLTFVQKAFLLGLFSAELIIGRNFVFQNRLG